MARSRIYSARSHVIAAHNGDHDIFRRPRRNKTPRSGFVQRGARPNDEERGQPSVPVRPSLARSSSSVSFSFGITPMASAILFQDQFFYVSNQRFRSLIEF